MSGDTPVILVAHNGNSFDHDRFFLSFLERNHELYELSEHFPKTLFFGNSFPTARKLKTKLDLPSCKLSDVYGKFFAEDFAAHDAVADVTALGRIIPPSSATTLQSGIKSTCKSLKFLCGQRVLNTERSQIEKKLLRLCSNEEMSKKLSKLGFSVELLEEFWQSFGPDVFVSFLSGKEPRARLPRVSKNVKEIGNLIKKLSEWIEQIGTGEVVRNMSLFQSFFSKIQQKLVSYSQSILILEGTSILGYTWCAVFQGITFQWKFLNRVNKFAINSQNEYNFYDDFLKFWNIIRRIFLHEHFQLFFLVWRPKL